MNGKQLATIFLILAIFGIAQAAILKTELLTASLAEAAHQDEALHAIAGDMAAHKKSADYYFNEGPYGHRCDSDRECDGMRTCSGWGWCQGVSREIVSPNDAEESSLDVNSADYYFDEGPNGHRCDNDRECDGMRTCSGWGWCQGVSRP